MSHVLIVDDDPQIRLLLEMMLNMHDIHYESAIDGRDALNKQSQKPASVILLDYMLPDKDGREVYLELRRRGDHTPVIFLSAQPDIEDRTKDLNPVAIVSKPFQMNVLVNLLQSHLELAADASLTECDS